MLELTALYGGILWLVFKKFKLLPINTNTMVGSFLFGAMGLGYLLLMMNMYHPVTNDSRFVSVTTPIISEVRGRVTEVPVQPNTPLKAGDVLFKIEPDQYQDAVAAISAQLALASTRLKQESELVAQGAGNQYEVERYDADVKRLTAELAQAQQDLDSTVVRAPTDGYVTQLTLRPGMLAVPMPFSPLMVFVHSNAGDSAFIAAFRQNSLQGIDPGDEVEVSLDAVPGMVFAAKVKQIIPMMSEGQVQTSGLLRTIDGAAAKPGRVLVEVEFTDDMTPYKLPAGASGTTVVYTGSFHAVQIVRMFILRLHAWENYVFTA